MNLLLNILGYFLLFFSIELLLYVFCILLTIKEEIDIDFDTLFEDFKSYNGSASVGNKFKSINIFFILICVFLAIFSISIFFITKS
jgi:hypothetical protein